MTLIDGDRIITAQLYDDEHEEFTEKKMSIIDYINAYTDEGVTPADDVLNYIRTDVQALLDHYEKVNNPWGDRWEYTNPYKAVIKLFDKYTKGEDE